MEKLISRNKIITHYKQFFGLQDMGLAEGDHLTIDWAESLIETCVGKSDSTSEKDLRVCDVVASAWISVKERLPDFKVSVIWCDTDKLRFLGDLQEVEGMTALCSDTGYGSLSDSRVTHWMPLPDVPK